MSWQQRLAHPHYVLNTLLSLVLPVLVSRVKLDRNAVALLCLAPLVLVGQLHGIKGFGSLESVVEQATFQLRLFNLVGLFLLRGKLGDIRLVWWHAVAYLIAWLVVSFVYPQPPYLGPSKLTALTSEDFDEKVAIIPPATNFSTTSTLPDSSSPKIVELPSDAEIAAAYEARRRSSTAYAVVLFHAEWSKKSRELEITLSRLSWIYASPTLTFHLITPETGPSTFYDQNLSIHPTSLDLPVLRLYRGGKMLAQLPQGAEGIKAERRKARLAKRKEIDAERKARRRKGEKNEEDSASGSETDESDEEREAEQEVAMARYKWDRSARSIEEAFRLAERSGVPSAVTT